tara:strand:+ start:567 stop:1085 length:519 start_codon:yes stop_codon:yes gene_type:complete
MNPEIITRDNQGFSDKFANQAVELQKRLAEEKFLNALKSIKQIVIMYYRNIPIEILVTKDAGSIGLPVLRKYFDNNFDRATYDYDPNEISRIIFQAPDAKSSNQTFDGRFSIQHLGEEELLLFLECLSNSIPPKYTSYELKNNFELYVENVILAKKVIVYLDVDSHAEFGRK